MDNLTHLRAPLPDQARQARRNIVTAVVAVILVALVVAGWWRLDGSAFR